MQPDISVLCVPFTPYLGVKPRNVALLAELAQRIAENPEPVDVVVLPELAMSGYLLESLVSEAAFTRQELTELAVLLASSGMPSYTEWVLGLVLREQGEVYNCAAVIKNGQILHLHRKLFLPTYGMFDESRYFARGRVLECYAGALGKTAILICEDAWHLEMAFALSAQQADAVIVISASPARGLSEAAEFNSTVRWRQRLQTFAESYGQKYIYCNRGGVEDGVLFDATNFVFDALADNVPGIAYPVHQGAALYRLKKVSEMRHGFIGNSARQNDALLLRHLLQQ